MVVRSSCTASSVRTDRVVETETWKENDARSNNDVKTSTTATDESKTNHNDNGREEDSGTWWERTVTLYLPLVYVVVRKSMFGPVNFIRSLVVGQILRLLVSHGSRWVQVFDDNHYQDKILLPGWIHSYIDQFTAAVSRLADAMSLSSTAGPISAASTSSVVGSASMIFPNGNDPHAWPQQFLTALGVLTVFALVVHPDGFTWVVLRNIRDSILTVFSAIAGSWEVLGVFPTIAALITLSALFFLMFLVVRTLTPKTPKRPQQMQDKRKKKKKKETKSRSGRRGEGHRSQKQSMVSQRHPRTQQEPDRIAESNEDPDAASIKLSTGSVLTPLPELRTTQPSQMNHMLESFGHPELPPTSTYPPPTDSDAYYNPADDSHSLTNKRNRVSSQDTTPSLDDISCSSTSVRSFPSVSVGSSRSRDKSGSGKHTSTPSRKSTGPRSSSRRSSISPSKNGSQTEDTSSSRWDALRPDLNSNNSPGRHGYHPYQRSLYQYQEKQFRSGFVQRSSTRRGVQNVIRNNPSKIATTTPPTNQVVTANHDRDDTIKTAANITLPSVEQIASLPPPGVQTHFSSANLHRPGSTIDSSSSTADGIVLPWLRHHYFTDQGGQVKPSVFVESNTQSVLELPAKAEAGWKHDAQLFPSLSSSVAKSSYSPTILDSQSGRVGAYGHFASSTLKENPFDDSERRIEEELQELEQLGGQMAGSILDF